MKTFGTLLKAYRQEKELSQRELAEKCVPSLTKTYIFLLESGRKIAPPDETVLSIANALSISPQETQKILQAAKSERLVREFGENSQLNIVSVAQCLAVSFNKEDLITLTEHLEELATASK